MKIKTFFAALSLLLFATFATAQQGQREVVLDSTGTLFSRNGIIFQPRIVKYADGGEVYETTPLGDTSTVRNALVNAIIQQGRQYGNSAQIVMQQKLLVQSSRDLSRAYNNLTGEPGFREVARKFYKEFVDTIGVTKNWVWANGTSTPIRIDQQNNGNMRVRDLPGAAGAVTMNMHCETVIQLVNYPNSTTHTFLYRVKPKVWRTIDNSITLRLPQ